MAPGWPCSSAPSSSSSSSHTSTTFSCWWLGAWSKPFNLSLSLYLFSLILASYLLQPLYARLWLVWLILMSRLYRDSIPLWLISPDLKSQLGVGKGRVVNPERSPPAPALILPWSWLIFWHLSGWKPRCFCHVSLSAPWFVLLLFQLTCWETTVHSKAWHPHITLVTGIR